MADKILRISYIEGIPFLLFGDGNKAIIKLENIDFYNVLGRFNSIDALSEFSYSTSPFSFAGNNPVFWPLQD
jgi:hypothetical protein